MVKTLEVIAYARFIDEAVFSELHDHFLRTSVSFKEVADQSFIEPTGIKGRFIMHVLMRDYLSNMVATNEPLRATQIRQYSSQRNH